MDLSIENLSCRRVGRMVFGGLDFRLAGGRAAVLRGPNGIGKSTLLRVLAGLLPVAGGTVRFGDRSLMEDRTGFQEAISYVGHLDAVKPTLSIKENLALWASLNEKSVNCVDAALERFGLRRDAGRAAAECSAGQRRKLGLARLIVVDKPLWLLDEPTVSLDREGKTLVADLVREHTAKGGVALIATHEDPVLGDSSVLEMRPEGFSTWAGETDPFLDGVW